MLFLLLPALDLGQFKAKIVKKHKKMPSSSIQPAKRFAGLECHALGSSEFLFTRMSTNGYINGHEYF